MSDLISRQTILDRTVNRNSIWNIITDSKGNNLEDILNSIPSKMGQWVSSAIQGEIDGQIVKAFICSECGAISVFRIVDGEIVNGDLCPNCKADMRGET